MSETHVVEQMETDLNTTNQSADSGEILTMISVKSDASQKDFKLPICIHQSAASKKGELLGKSSSNFIFFRVAYVFTV